MLFLSLFTAHVSGTGTGFSGVTVLFGNILGISTEQTQSIALVSGVAILALAVIARPLLFASLDPDVAAARGEPVRGLGFFFMALLAVTVSEATLAVGALLVFALLLLPAAIAHQVTNRPYTALALAAGLAVALTRDAQVQLAFGRVARDHRMAALAEVDPGAFFVVKAQFALAVGRVRSVTGEALVGKDRTYVAVEAYRLWNGIGVNTHRRRDRNENSASDPASR